MGASYSIYGVPQPVIQPHRLLDVKNIFLNNRYDEPQWYGYIKTHSETWELLISPSPTLYKGNPTGCYWKRQFLSGDMMSKRLYILEPCLDQSDLI